MDPLPKPSRVNLPSLGRSLKALFTGYLVVVCAGLMVSGLQILLTHGKQDRWYLTVDDIVYSYYGNRGNSRLEEKLSGTMKDNASPQDRAELVKWVRNGSVKDDWDAHIGGIVAANCTKCHGVIVGLPNFTTYDGIKSYTAIDTGKSVSALTRLSHIHLFGIAFIFFFVGAIFSLTIGIPPWIKTLAIGFPFAFILIDIASWWLTKWYPGFAYLEIVGGFGYNAAAAFMILSSLYQMWILPRSGRTFGTNAWLEE